MTQSCAAAPHHLHLHEAKAKALRMEALPNCAEIPGRATHILSAKCSASNAMIEL